MVIKTRVEVREFDGQSVIDPGSCFYVIYGVDISLLWYEMQSPFTTKTETNRNYDERRIFNSFNQLTFVHAGRSTIFFCSYDPIRFGASIKTLAYDKFTVNL